MSENQSDQPKPEQPATPPAVETPASEGEKPKEVQVGLFVLPTGTSIIGLIVGEEPEAMLLLQARIFQIQKTGRHTCDFGFANFPTCGRGVFRLFKNHVMGQPEGIAPELVAAYGEHLNPKKIITPPKGVIVPGR